jgi:hypothetical protein
MAISIALAACAPATASPTGGALPLRNEVHDPEFTLVITSPRATWKENEAIQVQAELSYRGALQTTTIYSSGGGVIGFSVEEVNGDRKMDAIRDASCAKYTIGQGQPITTPFAKSGAINPGEPNEAFYREFLADPLFHLPAGRWRVTAWALLYTGPDWCGGREEDLRAALLITVQ